MRCGSLLVLVALAGCPGGNGAIGDHCSDRGDCSSSLQCVASTCVARCGRAPDCGDGYSCDAEGLCHLATGQLGAACTSEVECAAGLSCEIDGTATDAMGHLAASCVTQNAGKPAGDTCVTDGDCRNGTCALGHCVDLCADTRDCGEGTSCALIPRVEASGTMFAGCLQSHGALRWSLPVHGPSDTVELPIPAPYGIGSTDIARSVAVTFSVEDSNQLVGATQVIAPDGTIAVSGLIENGELVNYYTDPVRHKPDFGQSVLAMPSTPDHPLQRGGEYTLHVESQTTGPMGPSTGTATPSAIAVLKLDSSVILDLHFYFLNFDEHPCADKFEGHLDATAASTKSFFQNDYLLALRAIFANAGIALGTLTYEDLRDHPDLDGLDVANAPSLLALGSHDVGVNVFFVRTLSPVGLQAYAAAPGPAGLANTPGSGIVIGLDTLCYRSWNELARTTAHEIARYMGLYDNVDVGGNPDPIVDSDTSSSNLMFYSEKGQTDLSPGQRDILSRSAVLR